MKNIKNKSIFIFRRELRLEDNIALIEALKASDVLPIFIFTPEQVIKNEYKSDNAVQFMIESLKELDDELKSKGSKLHLFEGVPVEILKHLIKKHDIKSIYLNKDYTPYSQKRDEGIKKLCDEEKVDFKQCEDYMLNPVESILNKGNSYKVFKAYYTKAQQNKVEKPLKNEHKNYIKINDEKEIKWEDSKKYYKVNKDLALKGGRKEALKILKSLKEKLKNYKESRDFPLTNTTLLSSYLKFGVVSSREVYYIFKEVSEELIRQLYFRDFWAYITYFNPQVIKENYNKKFDNIKWKNDKDDFEKWKSGKTGVPIIDAGMRQLNKTGLMHNRVRMLTASFLIKNLLIDWRLGAKYFAQHLMDYCPMQNQNNWQAVSGSGVSALPWFRVMNPWLQQKKFDEYADYIKMWIPELEDVPEEDIHSWFKEFKYYKKIDYPEPMEYQKDFKV